MMNSINSTLASLQTGVQKRDQITVRLDPENIPIYYQKGNRPRAAAATFVFGLIVSACVVTLGRRAALNTARKRRASAAAGPPVAAEPEYAVSASTR